MVDACGEGGVWGPADGKVPVEEVCVGSRGGLVVWGGRVGEFGGFAHWEG